MKQAISGVAPAELEEVTVMTVWPSSARYALGRVLGRLYSIEGGFYVLTIGNLLALASIPLALPLFFHRLIPSVFGAPIHGVCYRLTNRRVLELRNEVYACTGEHAGSPAQQKRRGWVTIAVAGVLFVAALLCMTPAVSWWVFIAALLVGIGILKFFWLDFRFEAETKSVDLDRFDRVEIQQRPGQEWYQAGDLVFYLGDLETFRLEGVSRPETFRHTCLKSHQSHVGVKQALEREAVPA